MAETLLLPVVRAATGKAADALVQRVTSMCGVDDDRHKLERQLLAVQYKLADAELKSETNKYIKRWMKDFRTVAYEANDVLDGFQYEALRREAQIGNSKTRKVLSHFTSHSPLLFRFDASRKLSNVLKKINELVEETNKFGLVERTEPPQLLYRHTHSALDDSADIFGRDDDKELLVKLLLGQRDQSKVQVLPIFGMGGLGKTTLAKMVYNDGRVQQHFQLNMWHCVSENFEAVHLVKSVIALATQTECNLPNTIELLRGRLKEAIGHKRFLLVLDDVWNEDKRKWEDDLKPLLCSLGGPGSVILVTCRSRQVASIMTTLKSHELACLSEDDSWELFSRKAFCNGVEEQSELVTIGRAIVKKCGGLPLALRTIGGLMGSKQQVQEWKAIEESNIGDNACGKDEIISVLKLSYRHLPSEMKQCFAFCSVFAKDCEMEKDMLIQLWIANGLIQEERTMDLSQKGELIFRYLVWRSFLQDVKEKDVQFGRRRHKEICCKMHDLMHDLAKDVTDECATVGDLIQQRASINDTRHMQIITRSEVEQINGLLKVKGKADLHTLLEPCTPNKNLKELRLMSLRALHLYVPSIIHKQVLNAKHLRYLDLSESGIVRLPDSVCVLYNLQTLRLNGCWKLQLLPEDTSAMRKLIHIYLLGCDSLECMPQKFSLLKNLHTLTTFVVDSGDGRGINELKDLRHLANRLELYNLRKVKSGQDAKEANLHQKQNIRELSLYWGRSKDEKSEQEACTGEQVLDCLAPHSNLQILEVAGYLGLKVSRWMRDPQMFKWLRRLVISNCPSCEDLPVVWLSVSLECLFLKNLSSLTTLGKMTEVEYNTHLQIFPKLKEMALYDLPSLDRWMENSVGEPINSTVFHMLEVLHIKNCPKIASVPGSPVLKHLCIAGLCRPPISSLTHLTTLSELRYLGNDTVSTSIPMRSWPCLEKLEVQSLANMMAVPLEDQQSQSQRRALETLRGLSLYGPNCFVTSSGLSRSHLRYWECFAFVEELAIHYSNELVLWPMEELRNLARLRSLSIFACANLEGKVSQHEQTFPLPQLEKLDIRNCHSLMELPKLPTSLEQLKIFDCEKLVALPSNLGDLVKLRNLDIGVCRCLKVLPDGMDHLTRLERLSITRCTGIEKFPQGLHDRLHALGTLVINDCPELQRRCREGGEYFHSVSSVPQKSIWSTTTESSSKNFLRRLVPSCAGSN